MDVRLVAATNRDLTQMVADRQFRSDLFYRLNVFPVQVPPCGNGREDIPLLVRYFAQKYSRRMNKQIESIPADTMAALINYAWPGNIRELENLIERAVILSRGSVLEVPSGELRSSGGIGTAAIANSGQPPSGNIFFALCASPTGCSPDLPVLPQSSV